MVPKGQGWFVRNLKLGKPIEVMGTMLRYSVQILIFFLTYISNFQFLCGFSLEPCIQSTATVPSVIVQDHHNKAAHQTIKSPSMPCTGKGAAGWKHSLALLPQDWWNWQIKWVQSTSIGSFSAQEPSEWRFFFTPVGNFTEFHPRI